MRIGYPKYKRDKAILCLHVHKKENDAAPQLVPTCLHTYVDTDTGRFLFKIMFYEHCVVKVDFLLAWEA